MMTSISGVCADEALAGSDSFFSRTNNDTEVPSDHRCVEACPIKQELGKHPVQSNLTLLVWNFRALGPKADMHAPIA